MNNERKEQVIDIVKEFLGWLVVTALSFAYWMFVLLIASLILLNVWHVTFEEIVKYSVILMIITSVCYGINRIYKRYH